MRKGWNEVCSSALGCENFDSEQECGIVILEWEKRDGELWEGVSNKGLWRQLFELVMAGRMMRTRIDWEHEIP